jgi:amino acid transporter
MTLVASRPGLVRSIGRWSLVGLLLNGVIGSGVYRLPAEIARLVGGRAWIVWIVAGVAIGFIVASYAEVSSRFGNAGGQYLYARMAFGSFVGLQMGWISYLVRITSAATSVNLFAIYLAEFVPAVGRGPMPAVVAFCYLGAIASVNYRGVKHAAGLSNFFIVAKMLPLVAFGVVGAVLVGLQGAVEPKAVPVAAVGTWVEAVMLLIYAYGGFEAALIPLGEANEPERDAPIALFVGLASSMLLFTLVQLVTTWALPDAGAEARPLAAAARALVGPPGATFMAVAALLSLFGWGLATMVNTPRLTYAMAEQGDLPKVFGWVHPTYRTPGVSIVAYAVVAFALALSGSFIQNLTIAVISRLVTYGLVCLTVLVFRGRDGKDPELPPARLRLPGGGVIAVLGLGVSLFLATRLGLREIVIMAVVTGLGTLHWLLVRRKRISEVGS